MQEYRFGTHVLLLLVRPVGMPVITQLVALHSGILALPSMDLVDPELRLRWLT